MTPAKAAGIIPVLFLAACAHVPPPEGRVVQHEVRAKVAVSCVPEVLGPAPVYPDDDKTLKASPPDVRYGLIAAGRVMRNQRLSDVEPVIANCRDLVTNGSSTSAH